MRNARLYESQAGIKIAGRTINNLRYADDTTLTAESKEELKNHHLMMVKKESEKTALKLHIQKAKTMASGPITSWQMMGKKWKHWQNTSFSLAPKSLWMVTAARKLKYACSLEESYEKPRHSVYKALYMEYIYHFTHKVPYSQSFGFSSSHVWMWELDHKESWAPKNWCFWTVVLEKTLESPLVCKEIKLVHPKGNQFWIFIGTTDAEAEAPILCTWCEEPTHWKRPWSWERLKPGEEGVDRGWGCWMASLTQWAWVWVSSQKMVKDREA